MADAENETHSGDFPVLQPLLLKHYINEKACSRALRARVLGVLHNMACLASLAFFIKWCV